MDGGDLLLIGRQDFGHVLHKVGRALISRPQGKIYEHVPAPSPGQSFQVCYDNGLMAWTELVVIEEPLRQASVHPHGQELPLVDIAESAGGLIPKQPVDFIGGLRLPADTHRGSAAIGDKRRNPQGPQAPGPSQPVQYILQHPVAGVDWSSTLKCGPDLRLGGGVWACWLWLVGLWLVAHDRHKSRPRHRIRGRIRFGFLRRLHLFPPLGLKIYPAVR